MSLLSLPKHKLSPLLTFSTATRSASTSPYGRTHVAARHANKLPAPLVPHFPQRVIRADGSSFTHRITSPRSRIRLTRDTTNNPLWNATARLSLGPGNGKGGVEDEEEEGTGRMGRFRRRFEGVGGGGADAWDVLQEGAVASGSVMKEPPANKKAAAKPSKK
ncbi:hypothetical protein BJ138DRAFT_1072561 [Hygrophoropsis aurantiaca]|uniref:Uncharacterized protein n=1 Tax=Hygrophoropsis aurantiaca TaxID=72124 RepID=A0ACB7ZWX2_9AGAM|nr:hypothetical protein BJ138DRAFT_1072561 [Hygrophoropsis aurantiaca]